MEHRLRAKHFANARYPRFARQRNRNRATHRDFGGWLVTGDVQIGTSYFYDYNGRPIPNTVMCEDQNGDPTGACDCSAHARPNDQRMLGDVFTSITGVVYYSFNTFQLTPRGNADLVRQ